MQKEYFLLIITNLLQKFILLFILSLLAKNIPTSLFGEFRYNITLSTLLFLPLMGITSSLINNLSKYNNIDNKKIIVFNSLFLLLTLFALEIFIIGKFLNYNHILLLYMFSTCIDAFYIAFLSGIQSIKKLSFYRVLQTIFQLLAIYILISTNKLNYFNLSFFYNFASFFVFIFFEIISRELYLSFKFSKKIINKLIIFSISATIGSISYNLLLYINSIYINKYLSSSHYAQYSAAEMIATVFSILPLALSSFITSKMTKAENSSLKNEILFKNIKLYIVISFFLFIFMFITNKYFINLIYGVQYSYSSKLVIPICISTFFISLHTYFAQYFFSIFKPIIPAISLTVSCILSVIISKIFIIKFQLVGAAYSNIISTFFCFLLILYFFNKNRVEKQF